MKKLALTLTVTLACVAAFAQGKVRLVNDSLHLVYFADTFGPGQGLLPADQALAGRALPAGGPADQTLAVDLWVGTSASSLTKVVTTANSTFVGQPSAGIFSGVNISMQSPFNNAGTYFFQVQIYDAAAGSYAAAAAASNEYYGESAIFQSTANAGTAYYSVVQTISPANSTWVGNHAQTDVAPGAVGAISLVANVPEPTSLALFGLGAAGMLIFRRRK